MGTIALPYKDIDTLECPFLITSGLLTSLLIVSRLLDTPEAASNMSTQLGDIQILQADSKESEELLSSLLP